MEEAIEIEGKSLQNSKQNGGLGTSILRKMMSLGKSNWFSKNLKDSLRKNQADLYAIYE